VGVNCASNRGGGAGSGLRSTGCFDDQVGLRRADPWSDLPVNPVYKVLRWSVRGGLPDLGLFRLCLGPIFRRYGDHLHHGVQDEAGALSGLLGLLDSIIGARRPSELPAGVGRLAVMPAASGITLSGGLEAIGAFAEINPAEMKSEDLLFGIGLLHSRPVTASLAFRSTVWSAVKTFFTVCCVMVEAPSGACHLPNVGQDGAGYAQGINAWCS